jgi:LPS-assembly lipoprotein
MSSPELAQTVLSVRLLPRRAMLAAALLAAGLVGGCFQPLYSEATLSPQTGGSVRSALRSVEIPEIKGLIGHYLRNDLVFELDGSGAPDADKRLRFDAAINEAIEVVTVDYLNARADSAVLVATATWSLKDKASGKTVSSGVNSIRVPYERSSQRFATVRAARDAQIRAAKSLATIIRGQMAADLVTG